MSTPPSAEGIEQVAFGFIASRSAFSAIDLRLFTELAKRPLDANEIEARLNLHPRSVRDFLDALVALGMLERSGNLYANTAETDFYLDRAKRSYIGGLHEMFNARDYNFFAFADGLKTGRPQNEIKAGEDLFAALYGNPDALRAFLRAMTGDCPTIGNRDRTEVSMGEVQDLRRYRHGRRMPAHAGRAG